ncbi:MAG: nucleotidyltransferase family protein [Pseudomonadota bacterium]
MSGTVDAVLLAAGKSRRMGSCKQLLPLGGTTVIGRCLDTLVAAGISEIVVVVSPEGGLVAEAAREFPVRIVVNSAGEGDMASSVRAGRDAVSTKASGVIVALCDYPLVATATFEHLARQHYDSPDSIVMPTHAGRRGHPLLFPRSILDELTPDLTLRHLVSRYTDRICHVKVDDSGILVDMDSPEDYQRICDSVSTPA